VGLLGERDAQISNLERAAADADSARQAALRDLQAEVARVNVLQQTQEQTIAALNQEINQYKTDIEASRAGIDVHKAKVDEMAAKDRATSQDEKTQLGSQIKKLNDENLILKDQVLALRGARSSETLKGTDEYALVDGGVIGVDGANGRAFISLGRKNKVRVGMAFTVYADANAVRPDQDGNFPRGKATLEIINVDEVSSTCRIISESRGNPVVQGDVIVNAFYDPRKVYKLAIVGNFDVNRDGVATAMERNDLAALIREWGGVVTDKMAGDVDFLILGERPLPPPNPSADAPGEVFQEFIRLNKIVEDYDGMYEQARSTNVPSLTENRLYTLIGKTPAARR
jgi:hypothetical protein